MCPLSPRQGVSSGYEWRIPSTDWRLLNKRSIKGNKRELLSLGLCESLTITYFQRLGCYEMFNSKWDIFLKRPKQRDRRGCWMELSGRGYDQIMGFCKRDNETLCYKKKAESIMTGTLSFLKEEASRCS